MVPQVLDLEAQRLLQLHTDRMELFQCSLYYKLESEMKNKINVIIFKINKMYHMLLLKYHGKKRFSYDACCT